MENIHSPIDFIFGLVIPIILVPLEVPSLTHFSSSIDGIIHTVGLL